jgi:thiol:disulfide interchange protein DsbD
MLLAIGAALLGGIILNVMPCVFPVISLKAMGLVRHGGNPAQLRQEGLAFLAGVVATMLLLAGGLIAARAGGAAIGWGFQLQSPVVIAILALVMLGAALNLSGLFEVGLAAQRIGEGVSDRGGAIGATLTGALAIVVATPCTAPFMAPALGYALVQPPLAGLAIFLALAIGFAAPFTLLSLVPALAARMPRPGAWMEIVKRVLAFPMLGAAAWLVWVLDQQAGASALALILGCAIALAFAGWIYGMAQQRRMIGQGFKALYAVAAIGIALVAVALTGLHESDAGPAAPIVASAAAPASGPVPWSPETLATLRAQGNPVFVNFTASWCITCQVNDKAALSTAPVKQALSRTGTTYLVADSTKYNARIDQALAAFGRDGLPLYVVYPAGGGAPVILPQLLSPSIVVAALDAAGRKAPS